MVLMIVLGRAHSSPPVPHNREIPSSVQMPSPRSTTYAQPADQSSGCQCQQTGKDTTSNERSHPSEHERLSIPPFGTAAHQDTASGSSTRSHSIADRRDTIPEDDFPAFEPIPFDQFQRRNTPSWFAKGRVFRISSNHKDTVISGRHMVAIGITSSGVLCLPLCLETGIVNENVEFLRSRLQVLRKGARHRRHFSCPWKPVEIEMEEGREIRNDVWINCEKPYTVRTKNNDLKVASVGFLSKEGTKEVGNVYIDTQKRITGDEKTHEVFWVHMALFWAYIVGIPAVFRRRQEEMV
jgi:hypothetical protein